MTYHDAGMACVPLKYKTLTKILILFSCITANIAVVAANVTNITLFLSDLIGYDDFQVIKFGITVLFLVVIVLVPEPEKIKYLAFPAFASVIFVFLCMIFYNIYLETFQWDSTLTRQLFNWQNTT
jgi:uncharacterized membrane protein